MHRCVKKTLRLKVKCYAARLIDLNEHLYYFTGATMADRIGVTELNEIVLNSKPNSWSKQAYFQGFYCKSISFKNVINMFERMEIDESIYENAVKPYYKKITE